MGRFTKNDPRNQRHLREETSTKKEFFHEEVSYNTILPLRKITSLNKLREKNAVLQ